MVREERSWGEEGRKSCLALPSNNADDDSALQNYIIDRAIIHPDNTECQIMAIGNCRREQRSVPHQQWIRLMNSAVPLR